MRNMDLERKRPRGRGSSRSVRGVQQKWYDASKRLHYKMDSTGRHEGLVEYMVSQVLNHVTVNGETFPHVDYWLEDLNGSTVTVSKSFLQRSEKEISFEDAIRFNLELAVLEESTSLDVSGRIVAIVTALSRLFGLPDLPQNYGVTMLLDQLFLNEDRHWCNSAIISGSQGYRVAPMFDNGRGLGVSLSKLDSAWDYFEPNPYNGDQLVAIPQLLGDTKVSVKWTDISLDTLRLALYLFYLELVVDGYLAVLETLVSSRSKMPFAEYLEVT